MNTEQQFNPRTGSESSNAMAGGTVEGLLRSLALSNNGYLFAPTAREAEGARANPLFFVMAGGLIYGRGRAPERFADAPRAQRPLRLVTDCPDYEALILARQEASGFYD